ncbi:MAG TPA: prepilin-type N-terminal cleavage/methylation domain-containing protein, partial [Phycisphaerae bacterium]|nr:prepilin-type N-terminal cleavage/methylation domain-containing protein [Phycisphaerae bacterium]
AMAARARVRRGGFTLVELMLAMMVSGMILSAVAGLAWALGTYNGQGEAVAELAIQGRFASTLLARDLRAARVATVSDGGALVLWMGDTYANDLLDIEEIVVYRYQALPQQVERCSFVGGYGVTYINPDGIWNVAIAADAGILDWAGSVLGYTMSKQVVCNHVAGLSFYPKRAYPQTASLEYVLRLSRAEDIVRGTGQTVDLNFYGTGTLRAPLVNDDFCSQLQ